MEICLCSVPFLIMNLVIIAITYDSIKKLNKRISSLENIINQLLEKNLKNSFEENKQSNLANNASDNIVETEEIYNSNISNNKLEQNEELLSNKDILENNNDSSFCNTENKTRTQNQINYFRNFETFFGGRILNIIGSIILIMGLGLLIKYAFDHDWINEAMIVSIGALIGIGFIYFAGIFHKKGYAYFPQGLAGTGISILYLSDYASYNLYNLLPASVAFFFGVGISIIAIFSALKYDSLAVSFLGLVGGFLTPFLLASNNSQIIGFLAYLSLLNIGILALVFKRQDWYILKVITLIATYISFFIVAIDIFSSYATVKTYFINFIIISYLISSVINKENKLLIPILSGLFYLIAIYSYQTDSNVLSLIFFLIGFIHIIFSEIIEKIPQSLKKLYNSVILIGIISILVSINLYFTGFIGSYISIICYSLLALLIIYISKIKNKSVFWKYALVLFCLILLKIIFNDGSFAYPVNETFMPFTNIRFIAYSSFIACILLGKYILKKISPCINARIIDLLNFCCIILTFIFLNIEFIDIYNKYINIKNFEAASIHNYNYGLMLSLFDLIFSIIVIRLGISAKSWVYNIIGYPILFLSLMYILIDGSTTYPLEYFTPIINIRVLSFGASIIGIYILKRWYNKSSESKNNYIQIIINLTTCLFIFTLITSEINDYFNSITIINKLNTTLTDTLMYNKILVFDLIWSIYSLILLYFGLLRKQKVFYYSGLIILSLALIVSIVNSLFYIPIESFVLIFNVRFVVMITLLICLIAFHKILTIHKENCNQFLYDQRIVKFLISALILVLITSESSTFYELQLNGSASDNLLTQINSQKQFVLSALWMAYSIILMLWGIYKRSKVVRITSILLFSLTIFKLFLVDLSFLDSMLRVISFICLGFILIFASYLYQKYKDIILEPEK